MKPSMIYGIAWKESATPDLALHAVSEGFRAIDTANQKKHYREDYLGEALRELDRRGVHRRDLFLQSKYTYAEGQDHRLPYDPQDPLTKQVQDSFESSLKNLNTDYLDSYLLHGPRSMSDFTEDDWEVWAAMEDLQRSGKARVIGVSNVAFKHLEELCQNARIKPAYVQNRCYAATGWDRQVREFCLEQGIVYQGFSLLTANPQVVTDPRVGEIARRHAATPAQIIFRFAMQIGILPLTGTTNPEHMQQDLEAQSLSLSDDEVNSLL